ncbi:hypothetical protein EPL73_21440, partial [Clostridioides difficile]|nr:hypothetical protein [Clostridioides difficile]
LRGQLAERRAGRLLRPLRLLQLRFVGFKLAFGLDDLALKLVPFVGADLALVLGHGLQLRAQNLQAVFGLLDLVRQLAGLLRKQRHVPRIELQRGLDLVQFFLGLRRGGIDLAHGRLKV